MISSLLALYVQLNLLLAAAWLLWIVTKAITGLLKIEVSLQRQLGVARHLFIAVLVIVPCVLLGRLLPADWLSGIMRAGDRWPIPDIMVIAGLESSLERPYLLGGAQLHPSLLFTFVLLAGIVWQAHGLLSALRHLQHIVDEATEWKTFGRVHLLFSQRVTAPFSTCALGRKQIVLPYSLLATPRNLRLAVMHELQHLRNGDLGWVLLLEGVKRLCFWNPVAHLWQYEFDCLQEMACDEVLVQKKQVSPQHYGNCLLDVASANASHTLVAVASMVPKLSLLQNNHSQLKRRILMLGRTNSNKRVGLKVAAYGLMLAAGMFNAALVVFAADQGSDNKSYIPVIRVNPAYPASAIEQKQVGWVKVEFAIGTDGSVQDATVVENCVRLQSAAPESCTPNPLFDAATLAALRQWRYEPVVENGAAVRVEGVLTIMRYELGEEDSAPTQQ